MLIQIIPDVVNPLHIARLKKLEKYNEICTCRFSIGVVNLRNSSFHFRVGSSEDLSTQFPYLVLVCIITDYSSMHLNNIRVCLLSLIPQRNISEMG